MMEPRDFRKIRETLDLSPDEFALELGYIGSRDGNRKTIARLEKGDRPIPMAVAKLAWMFSEYGLPDEWPDYLDATMEVAVETGQ